MISDFHYNQNKLNHYGGSRFLPNLLPFFLCSIAFTLLILHSILISLLFLGYSRASEVQALLRMPLPRWLFWGIISRHFLFYFITLSVLGLNITCVMRSSLTTFFSVVTYNLIDHILSFSLLYFFFIIVYHHFAFYAFLFIHYLLSVFLPPKCTLHEAGIFVCLISPLSPVTKRV